MQLASAEVAMATASVMTRPVVRRRTSIKFIVRREQRLVKPEGAEERRSESDRWDTIEVMKVAARVFAVALAFGVSGAPVVLQHCLKACDAMADARSQEQPSTDHPCHHPTDSAAAHGFRGETKPCHHDDGPAGTMAAGAGDAGKSAQWFHHSVALVAFASLPALVADTIGSPPSVRPPGSSFFVSRALPLRI